MKMDKTGKSDIIKGFAGHVSPGKVDVFREYGMEFVMGKREGITIEDIDGRKRLINLHSNGGVFNLGHRNPEIVEALIDAAGRLDIGNHHFISEQRTKLARKMAELMPGDLNFTVFGVSGAEAVDLAIKLAIGHTRRSEIISTIGGFHGHTGLAVATGDDQYREPFGLTGSFVKRVPYNDIEAFRKALKPNVAAVILESVQATAGIVIPDGNYIQEVRKLCTENGSLLIMDEVQTGLGRTGTLWAFEQYGILPDMVVLGKGLSGGMYPMSATVIREPLMKIFREHPFSHISTYGGSEIGSEVSLKVLEMSSKPAFLSHVNRMAALFARGFEAMMKKYPRQIHSYRQKGLMMGLKFHDEERGLLFTKTAYESGLWVIYSNNDKSVSQILPPLIIQEQEVEEVLKRMDSAVSKLKYYRAALRVKGVMNALTGKKSRDAVHGS